MLYRTPKSLCAIAALAVAIAMPATAVMAKSAVQKECSEKYQAAKAGNALAGQTYNQFYKQCAAQIRAGGSPTATPTTAPAPAPVTPAPAPQTTTAAPVKPPVAPAPVATAPAPAPAPAAATVAAPTRPVAPAPTESVGNAVFPSALSPTFASEKPGKARMHTCLAQYNANKPTNANGGLKWIQTGGGYYSECNKRLKS